MSTSNATSVTVRFDPTSNSQQADIIQAATPQNAGVMTAAQVRKLDALVADDDAENVNLYSDPTTGSDSNSGTSPAAALQTFQALIDAKPAIYHKACRFFPNIDPPQVDPSVPNLTKKVYTLTDEAVEFLFSVAEGENAESTLIDGKFTNELGQKTATGGSDDTVITDQSLTLDQYADGGVVRIVGGTGAGQMREINSVTAGPNSVITIQGLFDTPPDATSEYQIGYPATQIHFTKRLLLEAPPQNVFWVGIEFINDGSDDFQLGNVQGSGGGGASVFTGCKFTLNGAAMRDRGTARGQFSADPTYWVGPNNPFNDSDFGAGCYFESGTFSTNVSGQMISTGCVLRGIAMSARSASAQIWGAACLDDSQLQVSNFATADASAQNATQRAQIKNCSSNPAVRVSAGGMLTGPNARLPALNNTDFKDNSGDCIRVETNSFAYLGDITSSGNGGVGCKVLTGSTVQISPTTDFSGCAGGEFQVDSGPKLTKAQVLAAPFGGTLRSNANMPYPIPDPGTGAAIPVTVSGGVALTVGAGAETNTLAIPTFVGQELTFSVSVAGGGTRTITAASAINLAGNTNLALTLAGASITLRAMKVGAALAWRVVSNDGTVLT